MQARSFVPFAAARQPIRTLHQSASQQPIRTLHDNNQSEYSMTTANHSTA